jgi:hypothetical protein
VHVTKCGAEAKERSEARQVLTRVPLKEVVRTR